MSRRRPGGVARSRVATSRVAALLPVLGAALLAGALSCGEEEAATTEVEQFCAEVGTRLRGCQLLSEGQPSCVLFQVPGYVECFRPCLDAASCDDIRAQTCDDVDNAFAQCKDRCDFLALGSFDCGDGTRIDIDDRCDDTPDCANGADELRCDEPPAMFACGGGEIVFVSDQCNGTRDCANGADEAGCPTRAMTLCPGGF